MKEVTDLNSVLTKHTQPVLALEEMPGHCARGTHCLVEEVGVFLIFTMSSTVRWSIVSTKEGQRTSGELPESFLEEVCFENSNRDK